MERLPLIATGFGYEAWGEQFKELQHSKREVSMECNWKVTELCLLKKRTSKRSSQTSVYYLPKGQRFQKENTWKLRIKSPGLCYQSNCLTNLNHDSFLNLLWKDTDFQFWLHYLSFLCNAGISFWLVYNNFLERPAANDSHITTE